MNKGISILLICAVVLSMMPAIPISAERTTFVNGKPGGGGGTTGVDKSKLTIREAWWNDLIDADVAHANGKTGQNTVVVILDTGLGSNYVNLFPATNILTSYCYSYTKALGKDRIDWNKDTEGHGTAVTGTIIGYALSSYGYYVEGVAPDAKIIMYRVLYWVGGIGKAAVTYEQMINNWADAINRAISVHVNNLPTMNMVISMSLGYDVQNSANSNLESAVNAAVSHGIVVSVSAGNEGPAPDTTGYPADFANSCSVAAAKWTSLTGTYGLEGIFTNIPEGDFSLLDIAEFSSRGKVQITGIGENLILPMTDGFYYISGTSFSCPQISGVFALMFQAWGAQSVAWLLNKMQTTAYHTGSMTATTWGAGFVQADAAVA